MREARTDLTRAGIPDDEIHQETFGSPRPRTTATTDPPLPGPFAVSLTHSGVTADWTPKQGSLLDLADASGVTTTSGCRAGICQQCCQSLRQGHIAYTTTPALPAPDGGVLLCSAVPTSNLVIDA